MLLGWLVAIFALSAVRDLRLLSGSALLAVLVFRRGSGRGLQRTLRAVVAPVVGLSLASYLVLRLFGDEWPPAGPYLALSLRAGTIGFMTFSVLGRIQLIAALAPFETLSRVLAVTLAQIHALRLLSTESLQGLRSRMPRRPGLLDVVRGAGGITAALFTLATRNAHEISDAMRSRGF
jgi:cobalt/nickel transport system permease protein